jgi:hypothetical protein
MYAEWFTNVTRHPQPHSWQLQLGETEALADRLIRIPTGRDIAKPIGVAEWQTRLVHSLPESLKGSLPTIEEIEHELASIENEPTAPPTVVRKREKTKNE